MGLANRGSVCGLLFYLVEVSQKLVDRGVLGSIETIVFFAFGVEENDCREAFNFVFFGVGLILLGDFFVSARVIEFNEDEVLRGLLGEALFREDVFAHHLAGWAPVGTGEFHEDAFILFLCFGKGGFQVGGPVFVRSAGEGGGEEEGDGGNYCFHPL